MVAATAVITINGKQVKREEVAVGDLLPGSARDAVKTLQKWAGQAFAEMIQESTGAGAAAAPEENEDMGDVEESEEEEPVAKKPKRDS
ncbi:hypothetical protein DIPPA_02832 [Diplonema papillatum]|nr:hypothetical protein DIPPA_02832 [Diplonema papillatum]|eukprot:gene16097-24659_t